jgi:hypothetical protein
VGADQNGRNKHANKQKNSERFLFNKNISKSKLQSVCFETLVQEQQKPASPRQAAGIDSSEARVRDEEREVR